MIDLRGLTSGSFLQAQGVEGTGGGGNGGSLGETEKFNSPDQPVLPGGLREAPAPGFYL